VGHANVFYGWAPLSKIRSS